MSHHCAANNRISFSFTTKQYPTVSVHNFLSLNFKQFIHFTCMGDLFTSVSVCMSTGFLLEPEDSFGSLGTGLTGVLISLHGVLRIEPGSSSSGLPQVLLFLHCREEHSISRVSQRLHPSSQSGEQRKRGPEQKQEACPQTKLH